MFNYLIFFSIFITFHLILLNFLKEIRLVFFFTIILKLILVIINNNFFHIMDGGADAMGFHEVMLEYLGNDGEFITVYGIHPIYMLSQVGAYIYLIFGSDILFMQLLSLSISSLSIFVFFKCLKELKINSFQSHLAIIIFCFYPFLLNYSILTMREIYAVLLVLLSIFFFLKYFSTKNFIYPLMSVLPAFFMIYINGGLLIIHVVFFLFLLKAIIFTKKDNSIVLFLKLILFILIFYSILYFFISILNIPYLRNAKQFLSTIDPETIIQSQKYIQSKSSSNANYPLFLISNGNLFDFIIKSILRYFYFIFSPFPWDISSLTHFFSLIDPIVHLFLFSVILKNFSKVKNNEALIFLLLLYFIVTVIYSFGVANFSQGIRHKTKFISILFILSSNFYVKNFKDFLIFFKSRLIKKNIK